MKYRNHLVTILVLICLAFCTNTICSQENITNKDDFDEMSFKVTSRKTEYFPLEPIVVNFMFSNRTEKAITTFTPNFLGETQIKITSKDKEKVFNAISLLNVAQVRFPRTFQSGESIGQEIMLETNLNEFFPEIGSYNIQFVLSRGKKRINSNVIQINIIEPIGLDKEALNSLKENQGKNQSPDVLFDWKNEETEIGQNLLETFVFNYSKSVYGEFAAYKLGLYYFYNGDFDKAQIEFEKLKSSENSVIAKDAKKMLADIERKKADLQKMQKQTEKPQ